jgi:hypothetical protein
MNSSETKPKAPDYPELTPQEAAEYRTWFKNQYGWEPRPHEMEMHRVMKVENAALRERVAAQKPLTAE